MRKSIATVSMSGTLREKLEAIAAARFDGYELFENDLIHFKGSPAAAGAMAADLGLTCDLYQPFRDFEGAPDAAFRRSLDRAERKFDVMQAVGAELMLVCSNTSVDVVADEERAAAQLYELAERAAKRNLRIGYEALAWGRVVNLYGQAWSIINRANHSHLGLILDSFHTLSLRDDPAGIARIPGEKIDIFRETPNRRTAKDAMRSLLYLESQVRSWLNVAAKLAGESATASTRALERVELFHPPAAARLSSIAFLEFGVDDVSGATLGALLRRLGFRRAGKHRSKDINLYRQGSINLILNADPHSFARVHFSEYGPSVCAIGLATDDPVRAMNRAIALQAARFDAPMGPEAVPDPAITAPDGSLIYFIDEALGADGLFERGFDLAPDEFGTSTDAGLLTIDHIALGLPTDALDTWVLFCRAVLGMRPGDSLELSDPNGLIRSAGMASPNGGVRFVLNVSLSQRTHTARTIDTLGGRSVQHIGIGCSNIIPTVSNLRAAGVEFVPISPNYYDDLLASRDLDPALVTRMRDLGIVYDGSPDGEYFHVYGTSFSDRFFFEIVQRVGAYDGYGALNAPARMASQAQANATADTSNGLGP